MSEVIARLRAKQVARVVHEALAAWDAANSITDYTRWDDLPITVQRQRIEEVVELEKLGVDALMTLPEPPPRARALEEDEPLEPSRQALRNMIVATLIQMRPR